MCPPPAIGRWGGTTESLQVDRRGATVIPSPKTGRAARPPERGPAASTNDRGLSARPRPLGPRGPPDERRRPTGRDPLTAPPPTRARPRHRSPAPTPGPHPPPTGTTTGCS